MSAPKAASGDLLVPAAPNTPHVVGIDTSLTGTGLASSLGWCERYSGVEKLTKLPLLKRGRALLVLQREIYEAVQSPDLVVIEAPAYSRAGGGASERAGLWWLLVRALQRREIPVAEVNPTARMRYATGKGVASKGAVIDAVARRWPAYETGGDDNLADAVVLMALGMDHLGHPLAAMPATHRAALDKVTWPEVTA